MKTDMYNPANGAHYLASPSQVLLLERYGWVVYADWLAAQQQTATTTTSSPATTDPSTTSTDTSTDTTPAPTL